MRPEPESEARTAERRRSDRQADDSRLQLVLETDRLEGVTDNLSEAGVLFYSAEPLRVQVVFHDGTEERTRRGRLVRIQRTSESDVGFAVEFDDG